MSHQSENDPPSESPLHDDSLDEVSSIDPMDLYPLDEVSSILGDIADQVIVEVKSEVAALQDMRPTRRSGTRSYIDRPYAESEQGLLNDYFVENPVFNGTNFRRRFRMRRPLFLRIVEALDKVMSNVLLLYLMVEVLLSAG
ncbi:hypothetical protein OsI_19348 [Oryza sativa Indica Group]|uniref:Uncharacterized protein n=2 Tax=Oryza sativa TaxID=4530 RepID=B9FK41_ORYSJ|nr:hypothetical protein OsI_19348 [Oryza sativa Indica Group]EEE63137.1 hypothetical protein OsJ_17945 [Oryza sativa Japonica Group]